MNLKGIISVTNPQAESAVKFGGVDATQPVSRPVPLLGIVMPCHNEELTVEPAHATLTPLLSQMKADALISDWIMVFVDDGSSDSTWEKIKSLATLDPTIHGVRLSRNFGQQPAVMAGYAFCLGEDCDAVISLDVDLQDDISVMPEMARCYASGYDIVFGVRQSRDTDTFSKRMSSAAYYHIAKRMGVPGPYDCAEYRLMSRSALEVLGEYSERDLYLRGITGSVGLRTCEVECSRQPRQQGESSYNLSKLFSVASTGLLSFTTKPLNWVTGMGVFFCCVAIILLIWTLISVLFGLSVSGWASLMVSLWFASGCIMISLGVFGQYIGELLIETKHRPRFIISERL